jgi:hypothetical protein
VIAVSATRTGAGKSPIARRIALRLRVKGARVAVLRHPMPHGVLDHVGVQRFATISRRAAPVPSSARQSTLPVPGFGNGKPVPSQMPERATGLRSASRRR